MAEFIQNPRRAPRLQLAASHRWFRHRDRSRPPRRTWEATAAQLVSPRLVRRGEPVQLVVAHEAVKQPLRVAGRVAWASERAPWRLGIAYDDSAHPQTEDWFDELLAGVPGLSVFKRIPDRIPLDTTVYLAAPPRFVVDLTPDEAAVLRALGSGISVAELRSLLRDRWQTALRALFSLLAHQHVTLSRGSSVHPDAWRRILSEAESSLAVDSLRNAPIPELAPSLSTLPATPAASRGHAPVWSPTAPEGQPLQAQPWSPRARPHRFPTRPRRPSGLRVQRLRMARTQGHLPPPPNPVWRSLLPGSSRRPDVPPAWPAPAPRAPRHRPARGLTRGLDEVAGAPPPRSPGVPRSRSGSSAEAQGCYERALAELEAGRIMGATALLRRALALPPATPRFKGRSRGWRRESEVELRPRASSGHRPGSALRAAASAAFASGLRLRRPVPVAGRGPRGSDAPARGRVPRLRPRGEAEASQLLARPR